MKKNAEVIKHSSAIQITNNITLLQRRAWNVLLASAYNDLMVDEKHHIKIKELEQSLNFDSRNQKYLKETLEALATTGVKWDVLKKDGSSEWGIVPLLAGAVVYKGILTYAFSPFLREKLSNPSMYARISLSMQNRFNSKHALALYELFVDYFDIKRGRGETPAIAIGDFRDLMGLKKNEYTEFKRMNTRVIKEPLLEINSVSDLEVRVEYKREKRKVAALKFHIRRKEDSVALMPKTKSLTAEEKKQVDDWADNYERVFEALSENEQSDIMETAFEELPDFLKQYRGGRKEIVEKALMPNWIHMRNKILDERYPEQTQRE